MLQSIAEYYRVLQNVTEYYRVFLAHLLGPILGLVQKGIEGRDVNDVIRLRTRHQKRATVASQYLSCIEGCDDDGDFGRVLTEDVGDDSDLKLHTPPLQANICLA